MSHFDDDREYSSLLEMPSTNRFFQKQPSERLPTYFRVIGIEDVSLSAHKRAIIHPNIVQPSRRLVTIILFLSFLSLRIARILGKTYKTLPPVIAATKIISNIPMFFSPFQVYLRCSLLNHSSEVHISLFLHIITKGHLQ